MAATSEIVKCFWSPVWLLQAAAALYQVSDLTKLTLVYVYTYTAYRFTENVHCVSKKDARYYGF